MISLSPKFNDDRFSRGGEHMGVEETPTHRTPQQGPSYGGRGIGEHVFLGKFLRTRPLATRTSKLPIVCLHFLVFWSKLILIAFNQFPDYFWVQFDKRHGRTIAGED